MGMDQQINLKFQNKIKFMKVRKTVKRTERREHVLVRLNAQLKSGKKPEKVNKKSTGKIIELTDKDKTRINSEIKALKNRT